MEKWILMQSIRQLRLTNFVNIFFFSFSRPSKESLFSFSGPEANGHLFLLINSTIRQRLSDWLAVFRQQFFYHNFDMARLYITFIWTFFYTTHVFFIYLGVVWIQRLSCVCIFCLFFFFEPRLMTFLCKQCTLMGPVHCSQDPQISLFSNFFYQKWVLRYYLHI